MQRHADVMLFAVVAPVDLSELHGEQSALDDLPVLERYVSTGHSWHDGSPLVSWKYPVGHVWQFPLVMPYLPRSLKEFEKKC